MTIVLKRVYEPPSEQDGYRVLVDRLWPRGVSGEPARIDLWLRRIAPSDELREWYGHDVARWPEFRERYRDELVAHEDLLGLIRDIEGHRKVVTLLFGAKDEEHNQATVLTEVLANTPARASAGVPDGEGPRDDRLLARLAAAEKVCRLVRNSLSPKRRAEQAKKTYWWDVAAAVKEWEELAKP